MSFEVYIHKNKTVMSKEIDVCQQNKIVSNSFFYHLKATEVSFVDCAMLCSNTTITPSVFNVKSNVAQPLILA